MEIQKDFRELLSLFNDHKVEYIIIGSYALAFHGYPRYTGDIYLLVNPASYNAEKILHALSDFGFGSLNLTIEDFTSPGMIVQPGVPPIRIDLMTSITGVTWEDAYNGSVGGHYGDIEVRYLGKNQYVANKKATGTLKDLADIEAIGGEQI